LPTANSSFINNPFVSFALVPAGYFEFSTKFY
jgi:hypothetical protein